MLSSANHSGPASQDSEKARPRAGLEEAPGPRQPTGSLANDYRPQTGQGAAPWLA